MKSLRSAAVVFVAALALAGCTGRSSTMTVAASSATAEEFQAIIETLAAPEMEGRDAGTAGIDLARDYLVRRFEAVGLEPGFVVEAQPSYTQPFVVTTGSDAQSQPVRAMVSNVGAILPGQGALAGQVVVVGGHYDHVGYGHFGSRAQAAGAIHPGADDNASGTAGVVLLAQRLAAYAQANPDTPRRTVLFTCFAGEERGLLGSRYMVGRPEQWPFASKDLAGMINMDMIGRLDDQDLYIFDDQTGRQWRSWLLELNQDVGLDLKLDVRPPGSSDQAMFVAIGCPAVLFNTWPHEDYHTPADTPDKINAQGGARVIELVGRLLEKVATSDERIVYLGPPSPAPRPMLGVRLARGEAPGGVAGVLAQDVLQDGPSAEGGLRAGDIITAFDDTPVRSPGDLRRALNRKAPGDKVALTVSRDGKPANLTITLGSR